MPELSPGLEGLHGVIAPFTTPIRDDDSVELGAIQAQVDWLIGTYHSKRHVFLFL